MLALGNFPMFPKSILGIILVITLLNKREVHSQKTLQYPTVKREKVSDDYFGTKVKDPYRWLEKPDSEQVSEFIGDQNEFSQNYLTGCQQRRLFMEQLSELWVYPKFGRPEKRGGRYFYFAQQRGGEVLYVQENKAAVPKALIDPQENGILAFPNFGVSPDGEIVVYREVINEEESIRPTGRLRLLNVTGNVMEDVLHDIRNPQIAWDNKSSGFFYFSHKKHGSSDDSEEYSPKFYIYFHKVGTKSEADVLAIDYDNFGNEPDFVDMETSQDGQYLLLRTKTHSGSPKATKTNSTFYAMNYGQFLKTNGTEKLKLLPVVSRQNSPFIKYVTNIGTLFYFKSRIGSKNYKLVEVDIVNPEEDKWRVVIDENPQYVLQTATIADKSKVVVSYTSEKLNSYAELRDLKNGSLIRLFPLEFGELLSFSSRIDDSEVLFRSTKLEGLPELFYFDVREPKGPMKLLVQQPKLSNYDPTQFVTEVVTFPSVDGDNVRMILMYRKNLKKNGSNYAFIVEREFDLDFYFRVYLSYMKDFNAVVAFPHLEETGAGFRDSALEDFIASAEYLVDHGYTGHGKIISRGQSTFGLFAASSANKKPSLFGALIPSSVVFDMLRFDAAANVTEDLGAAATDPDYFNKTINISPLHNIRIPANESVQYPAIFIPETNTYPVPLAFKYIATLQHKLGKVPQQTNPFILRVIPALHDSSDIESFARYHIDRETNVRCFLEKSLGLRAVK